MVNGQEAMPYLIVMLVMAIVRPGKSISSTDSTSDFAPTVDDQYTWSALAQHHHQQRKGPTPLQDSLEWKWTTDNADDDPREKATIDRFLPSPWKKKPIAMDKKIPENQWNGRNMEDQGPGSIEIYRLGNLDDEQLHRLVLPPWNNPDFLHQRLSKSKAPKKTKVSQKIIKKSPLKILKLPNEKRKNIHDTHSPKESNSLSVPELQIGCEGGLESSMELTKRVPRSIGPLQNGSSSQEESTVPPPPPPPPVNPVTIDWDYHQQNHNYEEMDELLRLKELEKILNKRVKPRGDMRAEDYEEAEWDMKKVPLRGDLVGGRKVRSILRQVGGRHKDDDLWGFGENDGITDDDDYDENSIERIEADKRRKEYERRQREEWERQRREQLQHEKHNQRNWQQQTAQKTNDQVSTEINRIRSEYEARLTAEQREMERKLKDYIERNRPIVVESQENKNRRQLEAFRRLAEMNPTGSPPGRLQDRSRGPSPPATYPARPSWSSDAEARRRQYEYQRRREEENRRMDERRRQEERYNETRSRPVNDDWWRQRVQQERRRMELERRKEAENLVDNRSRLLEEGRRRQEEARRKAQQVAAKFRTEAEKKKQDDARRNRLPVSARIIITPRRSGTWTPDFGSRGGFGDDDLLMPINPSRPGLQAANFPAPPTRRPPVKPPSPCVWAVVQCCGAQNDPRRLNNCFEYLGCPGIAWDSNPCRSPVTNAAREEIEQYYALSNQP